MTAAPFFSVIIPTFNRAAMLKECLASVFEQRHRDFEVIVVDDGSTDDTAEVLSTYRERVSVLAQANRGPAAARNLGLERARGHYVAFLDSDDVWFPWSLEIYRHVIDGNHQPSFVAGKPARFYNLSSLAEQESAPRSTGFADYLASSDSWRWWGVSSFVVRLEALRRCGGFTSEFINGEDADLALRLGDAPGFVQITAPATFGYREHAGGATRTFSKTLAGAWHALRAEQSGRYPGGTGRALERRRILTRHLRPVMIESLRSHARGDAWRMYAATWSWHVADGRWRFLLGFPLMGVTPARALPVPEPESVA